MGIIFGWYSFKIKSYTPEQIGFNPPQWDNSLYEVRQKVFHLFWIPFFPIGKSYRVRKNGTLHYLPKNIEEVIKEKGIFRPPWYSFSLLIMIAIALAGVTVHEHYLERKYKKTMDKEKKEKREAYNKSIPEIKKKIHHLSKGNYVKLTNLDRNNNSNIFFLHTTDIQDSTYTFDILHVDSISSRPPLPNRVSQFYDNNKGNTKKIILTKSKLLQAVCRDYDIYSGYKSYGADLLDDGNLYIIEQIAYINRPIITELLNISSFWKTIRNNTFSASYNNLSSGSNIQFDLVNIGNTAQLVEISTEENEIEWITELPVELPKTPDIHNHGFHFTLKGRIKDFEAPYKLKLILTDGEETYSYTIEGRRGYYGTIYESK